MCRHRYTADYEHGPANLGQQCPYPELYQKFQQQGRDCPVLPIDEQGECIFHSRDADWKRQQNFEEHFLHVLAGLNADPSLRYFDFAEFVLVGSLGHDDGAGPQMSLRIAQASFSKQAYFTGARFEDTLILEEVKFLGGADFRQASFAGELLVSNSTFQGLTCGTAAFHKRVWFKNVEVTSYALFDQTKFSSEWVGYAVRFEDTKFDAITDFSEANFFLGKESATCFLRTQFHDSLNFDRTRFQCQVVFEDTVFFDNVDFIDTSFEIIGSSARYRGSAVEFNRVEVKAMSVLRFESTNPQQKLFSHDVQISFSKDPEGLIRFENVNFKNITAGSREQLTRLARFGRVEIGSGCIKYRFQTPISKIDVTEGNAPLVLKICQTFANYFTVSNGLNLGLEVVERTGSKIHYFFFTDENISEEEFLERLETTAGNMWSLLGVRSNEQFLELGTVGTATQALTKEQEQNSIVNAVDCVTTLFGLFWSVGARLALGRWTEADTQALLRASPLQSQGSGLANRLHLLLVDRYSGANLLSFNQNQHAGLILAYKEESSIDTIDFAILTAIEVERRAVCRTFGLTDEHRCRKGSRVYWRGGLELNTGETYELVVAQAPDAANIDAALLTNDLLRDWEPGAILLVGIAATADPKKVRLGDIVVGSEVFYYERGKVTPTGAKPEPKIISADSTLWANVSTLPDWKPRNLPARPDGTEDHPGVFFGVIASGEKVIADAVAREELTKAHRKILAIEMEGYGFSRAVWQSFKHVRHLDIRAICDGGDVEKNDHWHEYAAAGAADFARHLLSDQPLTPLRGRGSKP